jgi:hypothetical protein
MPGPVLALAGLPSDGDITLFQGVPVRASERGRFCPVPLAEADEPAGRDYTAAAHGVVLAHVSMMASGYDKGGSRAYAV